MTALKNIRRRRLLSQRDLASRAGVTASTVYLIEVGKSVPRLKIMRLICEALEIEDPHDVDEFRNALELAGA